MRQQRRAVGGVVQAVAGGGWVKTSIRYTQSINILIDNIYIYIYILPANDLVRCGHTLENHTPMS